MTDDTTQRDIGRLEGKVDALIKAVEEQGRQSSASRKALYERVGAIESDIKISAGIDVQVRQRLDAFEIRIDQEIKPTIDEVKRWKITGMTVLSMVGIAGASLGAFIMWGWEVIISKWNGGP
jgi:hypothetical protein